VRSMIDLPDASIVVNAHREGLMVASTLKSLDRAKAFAEKAGRTIEIVVCLDKGDDLTRAAINQFAPAGTAVIEASFGDLGLSRNFSVGKTCGKYIGFLDADDLFGETWIELAIRSAKCDRRPVVWHPEFNLYFGDGPRIVRHIDMEDEKYDPLWLISGNPWTALCFADRALFEQFPYPKTDLSRGVGYEDWGWYRQVIEAGWLHKSVKGAAHAIRVKPVSLVKQTTAAGVFPVATTLFRKMLERRAESAYRRQAIAPPR